MFAMKSITRHCDLLLLQTQYQWQISHMSRLVLYKRDASPPSNAVRMLGHILDLKFDYKEPDLVKMEHRTSEFKKINPMKTIPVLEDGDFRVSESHAIMKYLLEKYGGDHKERLYPSDVRVRAVVDQCLFFDAGVLFNRLLDVALPALLLKQSSVLPRQINAIEEAFEVVEAYLEQNKYVAADHLTLADLSIGSSVEAIQVIHKLDAEKFPLCVKWLERLNEEKCFKEINKPGAVLFGKLLRFLWRKSKELQK